MAKYQFRVVQKKKFFKQPLAAHGQGVLGHVGVTTK